jgi:hypothetical protein
MMPPRRRSNRYTLPKFSARSAPLLGPDIPDDAPAIVREGLARRRLVATTGRCPCGATLTVPAGALKPGTVTTVKIEHEDDCPAIADELLRWVQS